jgi:hypothetical protein
MFISVALGVIFGGIILFFLYRWFQNRVKGSSRRFNEHFKEFYGTPIHVAVYYRAKEYLEEKYGEDWLDKLGAWSRERGLLVGPEARILKLQEIAKQKDEKDKDWDMHFYVLHHWAIRQWANEIGDEGWFDKWEEDCIEQLKAMDPNPSESL